MDKIWIIAAREYKINVKRWSFWLLTLGLPLLMFSIAGVSIVIFVLTSGSGGSDEKKERLPTVLGVVDRAALVDWESLNQKETVGNKGRNVVKLLDEFALSEGLKQKIGSFINTVEKRGLTYKVFPDRDSGEAALRDKEIRGLLDLSEDFDRSFQARLLLYNEESQNRVSLNNLENLVRNKLLAKHIPEDRVVGILDPFRNIDIDYLNPKPKKETGKDPVIETSEKIKQVVLSLVFMIMMMILILTSTDRLLRGLVEEKANRVIELLLSSTTADQLMAGKVIGLGLLGLTQLAVWMGIGLIPFSFALTFISVDWITVLLFLIYFMLGYFLLATMILGLGSLGNNLQEAGQWTAVIVIIAVLPSMFITHLIENSNGILAHVLTYFPPTCPMVVLFRYGAGTIGFTEIVLSLALMVVSIFLAVKVGAKVFRVGILMTGKNPNPVQVWRALKNA